MSEQSFSIEEAKDFLEEGTLKLPFTLKLQKPIMLGSETKEVITIRNEPTMKDLKDLPLEGQTMGDFVGVLSKITGETRTLIEKLGIKDFNNLMTCTQPFMQ